jgi:hypothetical protein
MDRLEGVLQTVEPQAQYKGLSFELGDEIRAISLRDDSPHPLLWQQAFQDGRITITASEHKEMLDDLRENG